MTILSAITSISRPSKISKSVVSSSGGASLSMSSNSVACLSACGGSSYSYSSSYSRTGLGYSYNSSYSSSSGLGYNSSVEISIGSSCNCKTTKYNCSTSLQLVNHRQVNENIFSNSIATCNGNLMWYK
ncbi:hypothetical protein ACTFIV_000355 [Dictyostelium citrinum]